MHLGNGGDNLIIMTHKLLELQLQLIIAKLSFGSCLDCFSFFDLRIVNVSFGNSKLWTCLDQTIDLTSMQFEDVRI